MLDMRDIRCNKHLETIVIHHEPDIKIFVICQLIQIIFNDMFIILLTAKNNVYHRIKLHIILILQKFESRTRHIHFL